MIKIENYLGEIDIAHDYFVNLVGNTVINCFGVAAMATTGAKQGFLERMTKKLSTDKGIRVRTKNDKLIVEIHIIVTYGINISAIVKSIMNKVQYVIEEKTGFQVARVNVYIDGMKTE